MTGVQTCALPISRERKAQGGKARGGQGIAQVGQVGPVMVRRDPMADDDNLAFSARSRIGRRGEHVVQEFADGGAYLERSHLSRVGASPGSEALGSPIMRAMLCAKIRSEERRVGKECRSRWSPYN